MGVRKGPRQEPSAELAMMAVPYLPFQIGQTSWQGAEINVYVSCTTQPKMKGKKNKVPKGNPRGEKQLANVTIDAGVAVSELSLERFASIV